MTWPCPAQAAGLSPARRALAAGEAQMAAQLPPRQRDGPGGRSAQMITPGGRSGRDTKLDQLRRQYPQWRIWRGHTTGGYWALPPRGHPTERGLIGARDLDELARRLAQAEQR